MFGKKKREQAAEEAERKAEEARRKADEAVREAQEAEAHADAVKEKKRFSLFGSRKKKQEKSAREEKKEVSAPAAEAPKEEKPAAKSAPSRKELKRLEAEERQKETRIKELEIKLHRAEKKSKSARFCDFFAFLVLLFAAVLMLLGPLLKFVLTDKGIEAMNTVSIVAQYCLLAAIAIPAWYFVYRKNIAWKIVYLVALAGFIVGNILGLTL